MIYVICMLERALRKVFTQVFTSSLHLLGGGNQVVERKQQKKGGARKCNSALADLERQQLPTNHRGASAQRMPNHRTKGHAIRVEVGCHGDGCNLASIPPLCVSRVVCAMMMVVVYAVLHTSCAPARKVRTSAS